MINDEKINLIGEKKVLFISWTVPPIMGSHGRRVINMLKNMDSFGWKLDVLTISSNLNYPFYDIESIKKIPKSIRIFRVNSGLLAKFYYNFNKNIKNNKFDNEIDLLENLIRMLKFFISESNILYLLDWTPHAILKGYCLFRKNQYDILISSGLEQAPIIAYVLKLFDKRIPWIIDYGDPWVFSPTYKDDHTKFKFIVDRWLEKQILKSANLVIVTTEETKNSYLKNYRFLDGKNICVIPMGIDLDVFYNFKPIYSNKFRILYTGSIYPTQDIAPFLAAIRLLIRDTLLVEKIEILFIGNIDEKYKELININNFEKFFLFKKFLPYDEIIPLIKGADILLGFGAKGGLQVPGKLFDYLASCRPILWIKGDDNDPALNFILDSSHVTVTNNMPCCIYNSLLLLIKNHKAADSDEKICINNLSNLSWYSRMYALNNLCLNLIEKAK